MMSMDLDSRMDGGSDLMMLSDTVNSLNVSSRNVSDQVQQVCRYDCETGTLSADPQRAREEEPKRSEGQDDMETSGTDSDSDTTEYEEGLERIRREAKSEESLGKGGEIEIVSETDPECDIVSGRIKGETVFEKRAEPEKADTKMELQMSERKPCHLTIDHEVFDRWCSIGIAEGLATDTEIAKFFIRQYDKKSLPATTCIKCLAPLSLSCTKCISTLSPWRRLGRGRAPLRRVGRRPWRQTVATHIHGATSALTAPVGPTESSDKDDDDSSDGGGFVDDDFQCHFEPPASDSHQKRDCLTVVPSLKVESKDTSDGKVKSLISKFKLPPKQNPVLSKMKTPVTPNILKPKQVAGTEAGQQPQILPGPRKRGRPRKYPIGDPRSKSTKKDGPKRIVKRRRRDYHECRVCMAMFRSIAAVRMHLRKHAEEAQEQGQEEGENFTCDQCDKVFNSDRSFVDHMKRHKEEMQYHCDLCHDRHFRTVAERDRHMQTSHICQECGRKYRNPGHLQRHMRLHTGEKKYVCDSCGSRFIWESSLKRHMTTACAGRGEKGFICEICGGAYKDKISLRHHIRRHSEDRPFQCNLCSSAFRIRSSLQQHMMRHTGEKPHVCEICGKGFLESSKLRQHRRQHTGEKPYSCELCGFTCATGSNLKGHIMRRHTLIKRFKCELCNFATSESNKMTMHRRVHTGEKPYACNLCTARFSTPYTLRKHKEVHTGETPYVCAECGSGFRNKASLKAHKRFHKRDRTGKSNDQDEADKSGVAEASDSSNHDSFSMMRR